MQDQIEDALGNLTESCRISCPSCGHHRKKKHERTMGVTVDYDRIVYQCFHCGASGRINRRNEMPEPSKVVAITPKLDEHSQSLIQDFLTSRQINPNVTRHYNLVAGTKYFHGVGEVPAIGFVYGHPDAPEAIKWRSLTGKSFTQDGSAKSLFGLDMTDKNETLYICEGEADALALSTAGFHGLSVPGGAPNPNAQTKSDKRFDFIWQHQELFEDAKKVVLLGDADEPGQALIKEMARRIDASKCYTIDYPDECKDANEILIKLGAAELKKIVDAAKPMPLQGIYTIDDYEDQLAQLYDKGMGRGLSTGIAEVDELFTIAPGQLSVVTGLPGSGKSEFVDQIMVNMAQLHDWSFAICSFENPPPYHVAKLSEKITKKPFFLGHIERQTPDEFNAAKDFIRDHFVFLDQKDGEPATIDSIIKRAKQSVMRLGINGLVIDPYNFIDQSDSDKEHISISQLLTKVTSFAKAHGVHIWFVAHPAKMYAGADGKTPVPNGNHISGSAAWYAKADIGVTVHRSWNDETEIHSWKCRFKWIGKTGMTKLSYDLSNGIYSPLNSSQGYQYSGSFTPTNNAVQAEPHWLDNLDDF